jgi:chemotaxis response regulator CheB
MKPVVLLAQSDPLYLESLSEILTHGLEGIEIDLRTTNSREEALSIIEDVKPNLVVTGAFLNSPTMEYDNNAVPNVALSRGIKVIILSGSPEAFQDETRARCLHVLDKSSAVDCVKKIVAAIRAEVQPS